MSNLADRPTVALPVRMFVPHVPAPKGSVEVNAAGRGVRHSDRSKAFEAAIVEVLRRQLAMRVDGVPVAPGPYAGPVAVEAEFRFRPSRGMTETTPIAHSLGDLDKLQRALGDAFEKGGLLAEDSQVTTWCARKRWCVDDETPGVMFRVSASIEHSWSLFVMCSLCGDVLDSLHDGEVCYRNASEGIRRRFMGVQNVSGVHIESSGQ